NFDELYPLSIQGRNSNTYAGTTEVRHGTVELRKADGVTAIPGDLLIGGTVSIRSQQQIASTSNVQIGESGTLRFERGTQGIKNQIATLSGAEGSKVDLNKGFQDLV